MKCVLKELQSSSISKNNKLEVLTICRCVALAYLNGDMVLIYANGKTLEFHNSTRNNIALVYQDFMNQLVHCKPKPKPNLKLLEV